MTKHMGGPPGFSFCMATSAETADTELIRTFREWVLAEAEETMAVVNAMPRGRK